MSANAKALWQVKALRRIVMETDRPRGEACVAGAVAAQHCQRQQLHFRFPVFGTGRKQRHANTQNTQFEELFWIVMGDIENFEILEKRSGYFFVFSLY